VNRASTMTVLLISLGLGGSRLDAQDPMLGKREVDEEVPRCMRARHLAGSLPVGAPGFEPGTS
jgi:hypothetical protein